MMVNETEHGFNATKVCQMAKMCPSTSKCYCLNACMDIGLVRNLVYICFMALEYFWGVFEYNQ